MEHNFDFRKKIIVYGKLVKETAKFLEVNILSITQFASDSRTGDKIEINTDIYQRIPKNWVYSIKDTGKRRERRSSKPPKVITFKYRYHSKVIPKLLQKHAEHSKQRSSRS